MNDVWSLDLETESLDPNNPQFALEAFRVLQGKARITEMSVSGPDAYGNLVSDPNTEQIIEVLKFLRGKLVFAHNALFDLSWLYAQLHSTMGRVDMNILTAINWQDSMLLAKHLFNSQAEQFKKKDGQISGYSLAALVNRVLVPLGVSGAAVYVAMKGEDHIPGEDKMYWKERAMLDTHFTRLLAIELRKSLPESQRRVYLISQKQLPYTARAFVLGTPFNYDKCQELRPKIANARATLAGKLGVHQSVLTSPTQLGNLLFNDWGIEPISKSAKTGRGSTKAGDLKMIALNAIGTPLQDSMKCIMDFKKLATLESKYLNGFDRVNSYVGESVCHGSPRVFGTYTGRYTYASKTQKKQAFQISIAMHQLPKSGPAKSLVIPAEGMVTELDAAGQEIAFMAWASRDANMLSVLNQGMNMHSWMATNINGEDYDDFVVKIHNGDPVAYNTRQAGKLLNLSCQYRIGWKALIAKFFENYDIVIDQRMSNRYLTIYTSSYPGVPAYWKSTCVDAMQKGYAETIGGRRYYLTDWRTHRWATESSAINFPVQGSGADQKDLMIWLISEKFPEVTFKLDCHDGLFFDTPEDKELALEMRDFANKVDYASYWCCEIPMPLTFDCAVGSNYKDKKEL